MNSKTTVKSKDIEGVEYDVDISTLRWRPSAYGIVVKEGKILLTKQHDTYHLPGGGVEFGERFEDTVIREVKEETGIVVTNPRLVDVNTSIFTYYSQETNKNVHNQTVLLFYACDFVHGELSMDGFEEYEKQVGEMPEWFPYSELESIMSKSTFDWKSVVVRYLSTC